MKKFLLLLLTLVTLGFAASPVSAQYTLTVANGTETNSYVPFYGYYMDEVEHTQLIYPASMLSDMQGYSITQMEFYLSGNPSFTSSITISLGISTDATFSGTSFDNTTSLTPVYTGAIVIANNVMTVEFDSPFSYTGGNLLFDLTNTSGNYTSATFYGITASGASLNEYNSWSGISQQNFIPKTTFSYGTPSLCSKPTNVTATNITTSSATISWNGDANASSYNIEYMLSSETDWTNAQTATSTTASVDLMNLSGSSMYKVRVQTACSDNTETNWSSVSTFSTACDAISALPYSQNFEVEPVNGFVPCWTRYASDPSHMVYLNNSESWYWGSNILDFAYTPNCSTMAILPMFDSSIPVNTLMVEFDARRTSTTGGAFVLGALTDNEDITTFEAIDTINIESLTWEHFVMYCNGYTGGGQYLAFLVDNAGNGSRVLDNVVVNLIPDCPSPQKTSVTATDVDGHNATISWVDDDPTHSSWTLYYKASTDNDYQSVVVDNVTTYSFTGLTPETSYSVYVVTNCGGTPSTDATNIYTFSTLVACPAPTAVTASPVYINDATITWTSTSTVFNIEYGETGFTQGTGTTQTVYDNTVTLNSLTAGTSYTVYVQADCSSDNDGLSQWASVEFTTLPSCPSPTQIHASNLTTTSADLEWTPGYQESEWEVKFGPQGFDPDTVVGDVVTGTPLYQLQNLSANTRYDVYIRAICNAGDSSAWAPLYYFLTPCAATQLPYTENFDSYSSWSSPDCWRKFENGNSGGYVSFGAYIYNEQAYSGDKALKFVAGSSSTGYALLRLPEFDTQDITGLQVKMMAKNSSGSRPLIVGIMPDFNSVDSIYVLGTFSNLSGNYEEKIVSLESYPGNTGYLVIGLPKGYSSSATVYVDDLTVEERPNCMYPTNFATTSVGETSVTLSWTELGTADTWNVEYGPVGFTAGSGTSEIVYDSTTVTIDNLASSTAYDFYVQSDCGGMQSQWVGPLTVFTSQYTFGVTGSDTITTCGMALYDDGGLNGDYSTNCDFTLVIYPADPNAKMSLTGTSNTESGYDYLYVYDGVGTTGTQLAQYSGNQTVNVLSTTGPLTLKFTSDYTVVKAGLDLQAMCVTCFPPTNVAVSNVTTSGAEVSWSGNVSEYGVYVISSSDTNYYTTTDTFYVLNNLIPSSSYNVQVQAICSVDETSSLSTAVSFNTSCDPITITADSSWVETFEGYTGSGERPFICWETPVHPNGPFVYCGYAQSCHSGENSAEFKGSVNVLVLPTFTNNLSELRLSFWATAVPHPGTGVVEVGYMSDAYDTSTFVFLADAGAPGPRGDQEHVAGNGNYMGPFDFNGVTAPAGSRIALRYTNTGSATASWNLDDFTVELIPNCPSPVKTSVQATNVDAHSATITFTDNDADHNSWTVYYRESDADPSDPWLQETTSTTSVTLINLDPETEYDVYVITNCATTDPMPDATNTIQFTTTVACPAPTNVTVTNIDLTSATVSWDGNADSYTVTCGDFTTTVTGNTTNITGLTSATNYTVSVVADCGADGSSSATTATFATTICALADQCAYTFNLTDSWGDGWNGASITVQQNGVNVATVGLTSGSTATEVVNLCDNLPTTLIWNGGNYDSEASFTVNGPDGTEIYATSGTPSGTLTTFTTSCGGSGPVVTDPTVATQAASNIAQTTATLNGTITNPDNVTITEMGFEWMELIGTDYTHVTVTGSTLTYDLTNLTPNTDYIFKAFITYNGTTVYGNDLIFTTLAQGQPTEPSATTLPASAVTQTTATLNGTISNPDNVTITAQGFEWKQASATSYTTVNATGTTMASPITGLTANTDYTYRAFVTTANGTHYGADVTFTTLNQDVEPCDVPTGLTVSATTDESITITWDANANVSSWNIQYRPVGGTLSSATSNTNSYTINGLQPETSYEIQVQANCGDGNVSEWSSAVTGTTTVGIDSWLANSVSLYPNPAKEVVNVQCTMNNVQIEAVEVYDVYGKLINTVIVTENPTRINVSGLADGMYFVRVTTEEGMVTKTFVKR